MEILFLTKPYIGILYVPSSTLLAILEPIFGDVSTEKYTVVAKDDDSVFIRSCDDGQIIMINFLDYDSYWIYSEMGRFVEYYKRVEK